MVTVILRSGKALLVAYEYSRYLVAAMLVKKSDAADQLLRIMKLELLMCFLMRMLQRVRIKNLRADYGGEFRIQSTLLRRPKEQLSIADEYVVKK
jgi:hypothetical protein